MVQRTDLLFAELSLRSLLERRGDGCADRSGHHHENGQREEVFALAHHEGVGRLREVVVEPDEGEGRRQEGRPEVPDGRRGDDGKEIEERGDGGPAVGRAALPRA